ncbi:MAG: sulfite exporter TauE/SafE family protein, partial [Actinobacteria bacterium]|nr:sulfite exporter TauE/SafE family protein [Actinomycetota bacterium]
PGRVVGQRFMQAGRSAADYRNLLDVLFSRMDGNLLSGDPPVEAVTAVGVDAPVAVRRRDAVTRVRDYVQDRLTRDRSLAMLVPALRQEAAAADPQGCAAALHRLAGLGPLQRPLPAFAPWPLPRVGIPLMFLTCAIGALAPSESWVRWLVGGGLALAWFLAGWVMLARRPKEHGEHGFGATALPAFLFCGMPGVLGVVAGLVGAAFVTVPALVGQVLMVASVLVLVTTVSLSWSRAARRWKEELDLPGLRHRVDQMSALLADTLTAQWSPSEQRRVVADTLREVGSGVEQIAGALPEACAELFTPPERRDPVDLFTLSPGAAQSVQPEVLDVVVTDLVELARAALEPCWQAIESNIRTEPHLYSWRVRTLVEEYRNHIARNGLLAAPVFVTNSKPREVLAARVWTDSTEALAALESRIDDEMTQLCRSKQLNLISTSAGDVGVLRFAPHQLKQVREFGSSGRHPEMSREVVWTSAGDLAGTMRLVPLRLGTVQPVLGGETGPHDEGSTRHDQFG